MNTENSFSVDSGIISFFSISVFGESWESFVVVGDVKTSINGSFHSSENFVTNGGISQTYIQDSFEWGSSVTVVIENVVIFSVNFFLSIIIFIESQFVIESSCA